MNAEPQPTPPSAEATQVAKNIVTKVRSLNAIGGYYHSFDVMVAIVEGILICQNDALRKRVAELEAENKEIRQLLETEDSLELSCYDQLKASQSRITALEAAVQALTTERDRAVTFANKIEAGDAAFVKRINEEMAKIIELPLGKRLDESISQTVERLLATVQALEGDKKRLEQENMDHAEDWAFCGIPHGSLLEKGLVLRSENRDLRASIANIDAAARAFIAWICPLFRDKEPNTHPTLVALLDALPKDAALATHSEGNKTP